MKFISLGEETLVKSRNYGDVQEEIKRLSEISELSVFYNLKSPPQPTNLARTNREIFNSFKRSIRHKIPRRTQRKILVSDLSSYAERGGGGFGEFELLFHEFKFWLGVALVFAMSNISIGAFQEIGKDIYSWLKEQVKKGYLMRKRNLIILVKTAEGQLMFIFYDYFDKRTFKAAWDKMVKFPFGEFQIKKGEQGVFSFDTKKKNWKLIY